MRRRDLLGAMAGAAGLGVAGAARAVTAPTAPVTVELFALASGGWEPVILAFQKEFPTITVKWTKFGTDEHKQALRVGASSGKMPDVWFNWGGSLASPYNRGGFALEITPALQAELGIDKNLVPAAFELAKDRGKLYGIPNRIVPMSAIYRRDIYEKNGLKTPATFAELENNCEVLKKNGIIPFSTGGKFSWMTMRYVDYFIETYAGPELHDRLMAMEADWNDGAVVKGFAKLKDWVGKGYFNPGFLNIDPSTDLQLVYQGKAAMVFEVPSVEVSRMLRENIDPAGYAPFPVPTGHKPARVSGFQQQLQISAKAAPEVQQAALLFASYAVRPDVAATNMASIGSPSSVKGATPPANNPIQRQWSQWLDSGDVGLFLPTDQALPQQVVSSFFEAQDSVVLGAMSPEDAAAQIQDAVKNYKAANP